MKNPSESFESFLLFSLIFLGSNNSNLKSDTYSIYSEMIGMKLLSIYWPEVLPPKVSTSF